MTPDEPDEPEGADAPENVVAFPGGAGRPESDGEESGLDPTAGGPVPAELLLPALEACLFAVAAPIGVDRLADALKVGAEVVEEALEVLKERLVRTGSGVRLVPVGDGWQLRTDPRLATWVAAARGGKPMRLSRAAVETLAIVAFRQPVAKGVVDDIRGVDCGGVLRMLSDRGLVRVTGRADEPGRPLTWGTTPAFLELFGLRSLADLPTLRDLRQVDGDDAESAVVVPLPVEEDAARRMEELLGGPRLVPEPAPDPE